MVERLDSTRPDTRKNKIWKIIIKNSKHSANWRHDKKNYCCPTGIVATNPLIWKLTITPIKDAPNILEDLSPIRISPSEVCLRRQLMAAFVIHPVSHVRRCLLALRHFCLFCSSICGFFLWIFVFMCVVACGFYVFVVIAVLRICDYYLLLRIYIYVIYLCYQLIVIPTTLSFWKSHERQRLCRAAGPFGQGKLCVLWSFTLSMSVPIITGQYTIYIQCNQRPFL